MGQYNSNHKVSKANAKMIAEAGSLSSQGIDCVTTTVTSDYLQQMIQNIKKEKIKTLAYWRVQNPEIVSALEDFCNLGEDNRVESNVTDEERIKVLMEETQTLFDHLNPIMAKQENSVKFFPEQQIEQQQNDSLSETSVGHIGDKDIVAIMFGGKEANPARSLSEVLVDKLSQTCVHVYTVSRSNVIPTKSNITHIQTHELAEDSEAGVKAFADVITQAINDYFSRDSNDTKHESESNNRVKTLVIYFTMGYFKGNNPSQKNIILAKNFSNALSQVLSSTNTSPTGNNWGKDLKWKVIVTGTDATLPSQTPDRIADWRPEQKLTIPSYRIMKYNYVYALSKLGQYYIIATTISTILNTYQPKRISEIVENITQNIVAAGSDMMYNEENVGVNKYISMPELDDISFLWTDAVQPSILSHLAVVTDLTIMYTPLHCKTWVPEAVAKRHDNDEFHGSIRSNIIYQVVQRLKNAISLDMAARCHLKKMN